MAIVFVATAVEGIISTIPGSIPRQWTWKCYDSCFICIYMLYDIIALKIAEYIALAVIVECTAAVLDAPASARRCPWPPPVTGGGG